MPRTSAVPTITPAMTGVTHIEVQKVGRSYVVFAINAGGEHFAMTRTTDPVWADQYAQQVSYFFEAGITRDTHGPRDGIVYCD